MRVIFLQKDVFARMGIMYLSSILKKNGHYCDIFVENLEKDFFNEVIKAEPDMVVFSCTTGVHNWVLKTAERIKKTINVLVVVGGPHATFFPEIIKEPNIDIILRGEADYAFLDLVENLSIKKDIKKIKNAWVKVGDRIYKNGVGPLLEYLDELPWPDRTLYYKYPFFKKQQLQGVITGRGCPYSCSFCFNKPLRHLYLGKGKYVRKRSIDNVINEIKYMKMQVSVKRIIFEDDTFNIDKGWLLDFCHKYKKQIILPFSCALRADRIDDEILHALKSAGCFTVKMGIESGNEELRNKILKKGLTDKQITSAAKLIEKYNLKLKTYNILCFPTETIESAFETVYLNIKIGADFAHSQLLQTYPRTEITEKSIKIGLLKKDFDFNNLDYSVFTSSPLDIRYKNELYNLQKFFSLCVDFPFIIPFVKRIIKLKPNKLFDLIFKLVYSCKSIIYEKPGAVDSLKISIHSKNYFSKS